jgi:hypothetical protein
VVVEADDVASQVSDQLEAEVGQRPDSVDCPEDLQGEVGATTPASSPLVRRPSVCSSP